MESVNSPYWERAHFLKIKGVYSLRRMLPVYCQIIKYEREQSIKQKQANKNRAGEEQNNQRENDGES